MPGSRSDEGQFQPLQLTQTAVERYLTHLEQEGFSLNYRARVKSTISNFAEFLMKGNKLFQGNPTRGIKLLPEQPRGPADGPYGSSSH